MHTRRPWERGSRIVQRQCKPGSLGEPLRPIAERGRRSVTEEARHDRRAVGGLAQRLDDLPCVVEIVGLEPRCSASRERHRSPLLRQHLTQRHRGSVLVHVLDPMHDRADLLDDGAPVGDSLVQTSPTTHPRR